MAKTFNFDDEVIIGLENPTSQKNNKSKKVSTGKKKKSVNQTNKIKNEKKQTNNLQKGNIKSSKKQNTRQKDTTRSNKLAVQQEDIKSNKKQYNKKKRKPKVKKVPKVLTPEQEKTRKRIYKIIKIGIIILIIFIAIVLTMFSPLFNIKEILVSGNSKLSKDTIISLSGIIEGENTYKINKSKVEDKMKDSSAYIDNIKIKRILPSKIEIQVEERVATFMLEYGGGYVYLNEQGYILEISNEKLEIPIIQGASTSDENIKVGNRLCTEDLKKFSIVLKIMQSAIQADIAKLITKIDISNEENYKIVFETEQKTAHLGDGTNITNKIGYIQLFLEDEKTVPGEIFVNMDLNKRDPYFRKQI